MSLQLLSDEGPSFSSEAVAQRLCARVAPAFEADGWQVLAAEDDPRDWRLARHHSAIIQTLRFGVYGSAAGFAHVSKTDPTSELVEKPSVVQINIAIGLSCPAIAAALRALLPPDAAYLEADRTALGGSPDFSPGMNTIFPGARGLDGRWIGEMDELDAWITEFLAWYEGQGRVAFDNCRDMPSLNRLLHTPRSLEAPRGADLHEMLSTLVLVHFAGDPAAKFVDWLEVVRKSQAHFRMVASLHADRPEWYKDGPPREIRDNEIVERLIEQLRRRRAPNS